MKRWLEVQLSEGMYEEDLRLGMCPDMALLWSVKGEDPFKATGTIIVLEG